MLLRVDHLEFVGEHSVNDGGSRLFDFRAGSYGWLGVLIRHRNPDFDGYPDAQEIGLWRRGQDYFVLVPQSPSEQRLLALLQSASVNTNRWGGTPDCPSQDRLRWIINRIRDRKSPW